MSNNNHVYNFKYISQCKFNMMININTFFLSSLVWSMKGLG